MTENNKMDFYSFLKSILSVDQSKFADAVKLSLIAIIVLTACLIAVIKSLPDSALEFKELSNEDIIKQSKQDIEIQKKKDSLLRVYARKESKEKRNNRREINKITARLKERLPYCTHVSFWGVHNGGKTMTTLSKLYLEVYFSSSDDLETDYKEPKRVPEGVYWLAKKTLENDWLYVPNISRENELYYGRTKDMLRITGSKSIITALVSNEGSDWYIVSFSFSIENPSEKIENLYTKINDYKRFVKIRL